MLLIKDLPDANILRRFAERYEGVDSDAVIQFLNILSIGADLTEALDGFLATYGLLQGRWWVLLLLMREPNLTSTPSILAEKAGVTRATMTRLINGLVRDGLVSRQEDRNDRRSYTVGLTETGQAKLDEVMPDYYPRVSKLMNSIPAQQREVLLEQLLLLKKHSKVFK